MQRVTEETCTYQGLGAIHWAFIVELVGYQRLKRFSVTCYLGRLVL